MESAPRKIAVYVAGCSEEDFLGEPMRMDAVAMNLIVLGEGGGRLSDEVKASLDAPWPSIVSLRHRLAHAYPGVDMQIVWNVAVLHAPTLRRSRRDALEAR